MTEQYNVQRGDILVWKSKMRCWFLSPFDCLANLVRPEMDWNTHVDIACTDWQGEDTPLISATRKRLGHVESYKQRKRFFQSFVVLRCEDKDRINKAMYNACLLGGKFSDREGILVGLDILTSGGKRNIFRKHTKLDRYTCVSFVARCYEYEMPHLVLPNDFFMFYNLKKIAEYQI